MADTMTTETACPLQWPLNVPRTPSHRRKRGQFQVNFGKARTDMLNELERLLASAFVISSNMPTRPDGLPYADGRLVAPDSGVAVYFTRDGQRLCIACDSYESVASNIRGIGLTIDALRAIERHGSSHMVKAALVGFRALPAQAGPSAGEDWWTVLQVSRDAAPEIINAAWRQLVQRAHPDKGGTTEALLRVNTAWERAKAEGRVS